MKKVICFSLWGNNYRYTGGALQNADLAQIYYPDWICRYYLGHNTPTRLKEELSIRKNVELIEISQVCDWTGMFWRFLAASDPQVEVMISRDVDSRLLLREKLAVDEWINSREQFHIMRDHRYHSVPILGGMWGAKSGILTQIDKLIETFPKNNRHGIDQDFLGSVIYPLVKNESLVHDEFFEKKPFPSSSGPRNDEHFVGQAYWGDGSILDVNYYGKVFIQDFLKKENINLKIYDEFSTNY